MIKIKYKRVVIKLDGETLSEPSQFGTDITLCMNNDLPIIVIDLSEKDGLKRLIQGKKIGSIISKQKPLLKAV